MIWLPIILAIAFAGLSIIDFYLRAFAHAVFEAWTALLIVALLFLTYFALLP